MRYQMPLGHAVGMTRGAVALRSASESGETVRRIATA